MASARRAWAYNVNVGLEPLTGSRGRAPGQEVRGQSPLVAESFEVFAWSKAQNLLPKRQCRIIRPIWLHIQLQIWRGRDVEWSRCRKWSTKISGFIYLFILSMLYNNKFVICYFCFVKKFLSNTLLRSDCKKYSKHLSRRLERPSRRGPSPF